MTHRATHPVEGGTAADVPYGEDFQAPYAETKAIAEKAVLAANDSRLATVALRPRLIWGPGAVSYTHLDVYKRQMQDIPLGTQDKAWPLLEEAGRRLPEFADRPAFLGWGLKDFVFDKHFLAGFRAALPNAEVHAYDDAGHYVLEDKHETLVPLIRDFLQRNPL